MFQSGSGQGGCDCHPHYRWGRLLSNVEWDWNLNVDFFEPSVNISNRLFPHSVQVRLTSRYRFNFLSHYWLYIQSFIDNPRSCMIVFHLVSFSASHVGLLKASSFSGTQHMDIESLYSVLQCFWSKSSAHEYQKWWYTVCPSNNLFLSMILSTSVVLMNVFWPSRHNLMAVSECRMETEITCKSWTTLDVVPWVVVLYGEYGAMAVGQRAWFIGLIYASEATERTSW